MSAAAAPTRCFPVKDMILSCPDITTTAGRLQESFRVTRNAMPPTNGEPKFGVKREMFFGVKYCVKNWLKNCQAKVKRTMM
jgi:hypothetical protein